MTRRLECVSFACLLSAFLIATIVLMAAEVCRAQSQFPVSSSSQGSAESCESASVKTEDSLATESSVQPETPIYKYVGNLFSLKFHRPSCPFAKAMWRGNVVRFTYRKQAIDAGHKPCRYCLPPYWKSVGAKILNKQTELTGEVQSDTSQQAELPRPTEFSDSTAATLRRTDFEPVDKWSESREPSERNGLDQTNALPTGDDKTGNASTGTSLPGVSP